MRKKLKQQATRITGLVKKVRWDSVLAFTEKPGDERVLPADRTPRNQVANHPSASELFSMFTADIIKEDVVFTR